MKSIKLISLTTALLLSSAAAQADVVISDKHTKNITCSVGACVPDGPKAVLNVNDLVALLSTSDTTVFTGNGAVSISVEAPLSWTSSHKLTLNAYSSVYFKAPVTAEGTAAVNIVTNTQGLGGEVYFRPGGSLSFWDTNSQLTINGTAYTLFADLAVFADDVAANPAGNFALAKDFDAFADGIFPHSVVTTAFQGSLEGLGHTVDRLSINDSNPDDQLVGLFSRLEVASRVANLHLTNASITSNYASIGGIAGVGLGTIDHVWVGGSMKAGWYAAGIVGQNDGSINRAYSAVTLSGVVCGGITGFNDGGVISLSTASGSTIQCEAAGGFVGINQGNISLSSASAAVSSNFDRAQIGGLVGENAGRIDQSFATGSVTQVKSQNRRRYGSVSPADLSARVGGLAGFSGGSITNSYSTGPISVLQSRRNAAGGLVGLYYSGSIGAAYSTGLVNATSRSYLGGSIGYDERATRDKSSVYWDLDTSGVPDISKGAGNIAFDPGLKGATDQHLKSGLPKGFDPKIWGSDPNINNGYPYLLANPPPK
ncbi:MAG: hypothetical protein JO056_00010 [Alphaproteobacteria bacterium]|nr:hypothetical protein [Alphaproteobacteria bacterium]